MINIFNIIVMFVSLNLASAGFASAQNKKFTIIEIKQILLCQGSIKCVGSSSHGGPCYTGHGGPLYAGHGGKCYDGHGGPLYSGHGGPLYAGHGGNCYTGHGGACYAGNGGNCDSNSRDRSEESKCPLQCLTVCGD